jgi:hypothetical protein
MFTVTRQLGLGSCPLLPDCVTAIAMTEGHGHIASVKTASTFTVGCGDHCTWFLVLIEFEGLIPCL